jgi:hypothetical protein
VQMLKTCASQCRSTVWDFGLPTRVTGINHNSVLNWVRQAETVLTDENYEFPETTQIDELQTFVGSKKTRSGSGRS